MAVRSNRSSRLFPADGVARDSHERNQALDVTASAERLPLRLHFLSSAGEFSHYAGETPLAEIRFGLDAEPTNHPAATVAMAQLNSSSAVEMWSSRLPVQYSEMNGIRFATNDEILFGVVSDSSPVEGPDFERRVQKMYLDVFSLIETQGYPHLLRMWNYFPGINRYYDGLENYQRFCRARSQAFQERFGDFIGLLPSASAIGTAQGPFVLYFIASRAAGAHRENPRQVSAYSYPRQYGPRSPSFARATLSRLNGKEFFFISGTASIVGHQSLHVGDVRAQLDETLRNIEALVESTARDEHTAFRDLADLEHVKVYLRNASDLDVARELIHHRVGPSVNALFLVGDICRRELLIEVEAVIGN